MSRSQESIKNPAQRWFSWHGNGTFTYYDKDKKENVEVATPFPFLVLDELATISGFCQPDNSGYWANEARNTTKQPFTVRTKLGVKETGLYQELTSRAKGAKYCKSVYIAFYEGEDTDKKLYLGNIKFVGAALSAWIEFSKHYKTSEGAVILTGKSEEKTNGATKYFEPKFRFQANVTDEAEAEAKALDRELQVYLKSYFSLQSETSGDEEEDYQTARDSELNEFDDERAATAVGANAYGSSYGEHIQKDMDEIPF